MKKEMLLHILHMFRREGNIVKTLGLYLMAYIKWTNFLKDVTYWHWNKKQQKI